MSLDALIGRLVSASEPNRRLDAEVLAVTLGPDVRLNPVEDIDGWSLDRMNGRRREHFMASDDVPYVTRYLDSAVGAVALARPAEAAAIIFRGLRRAKAPAADESVADYVATLSRLIAVELIEAARTAHQIERVPSRAA